MFFRFFFFNVDCYANVTNFVYEQIIYLGFIFKCYRSFSMSIFEISSERGKVERISDLSPDGADLSMQQSTVKGLQEVDSNFWCLLNGVVYSVYLILVNNNAC